MDHPTRSLLISLGPTAQQQENWAVRKNRLLSDGQITELRIHIYPYADEKGQCFDLEECTVYRSSLPSMPRFTICSTCKGHSQNVAHSSLTVKLLSSSGVLLVISQKRINSPILMLGLVSLTAPPLQLL